MKIEFKTNRTCREKIELINRWCDSAEKTYMEDEVDVEHLTHRHNTYHRSARNRANIISIILMLLLIFVCKTVFYHQFWGYLIAGLLVIIIINRLTRTLVYNEGKEGQVFDTLRRLHRDWKHLEELYSMEMDNEQFLRESGERIATAERRGDVNQKEILMKKFRRDHRVLTKFGISCEDWGEYIPKPQSILETGDGDRFGI